MAKQKSVAKAVQDYATSWRRQFLEGTGPGNSSLESFVHESLKAGVIDTVLGIEESFGRRQLKVNSTEPQGILQEQVEVIAALVKKKFLPLFVYEVENYKWTPKELKQLRTSFRQRVLDKVDDLLGAEIEALAQKVAEHELERLMNDDEWIVVIEGKLEKT